MQKQEGQLPLLWFLSQTGANTWQRYHLTTDAWGNTTEIKVQKGTSSSSWSSGRTLASYAYSGNNGYLQRMTYGNGAYETYQYDRYGRTAVISHYASNNTLNYAEVYVYDAYGNTADCKVVNSSGAVTAEYRYTYDSIGRLIRSELIKGSTTAMRTEHLYDANNRLTKQSYTVGGSTFTEQYTYNEGDGSLHTMDTASGDTISLSYDEIKRVSGIEAGSRYTKAFDYVTAANGKTGTQISNLRYSGFTNAPTFCYTYTADGKIASETANGATWNYTYDLQGQLLSASNGSATYSYSYDAAGNILAANGKTYTYGDSNWTDLLTAFNNQTITYDAIGNPTSYYNGTHWDMTWANGRKLMSAASGSTSLSFTYDVSGLRETKTVNNVTHTYTYAGGRLLRETIRIGEDEEVLDFAYDTNGAPYTLTIDETKYYYITNVQGDVMCLVDANGETVVQYTYDPWGKLLSTSGRMADTLGEINPIRYRGYYYDTETGFYYLQSRYYDPAICRFINADAFASTGQGFLGYNMFAYCGNCPSVALDTSGCLPTSVFGDLPYPGYVHMLVQAQIVARSCGSITMEVAVTMANGKMGRIDLLNLNTGEIWEVKHRSSVAVGNATNQLNDYLSGKTYRPFEKSLKKGGWIASGQVQVAEELYANYWYEGNGVILYEFTNKKRNYNWDLFPETSTLGNYMGNTALLPAQSYTSYGAASMILACVGGMMFYGAGGGGLRSVLGQFSDR